MNDINDCCKDQSNLEMTERREVANVQIPDAPGVLIKRVCKVCSRRHFVLKPAPGLIGTDGVGRK